MEAATVAADIVREAEEAANDAAAARIEAQAKAGKLLREMYEWVSATLSRWLPVASVPHEVRAD